MAPSKSVAPAAPRHESPKEGALPSADAMSSRTNFDALETSIAVGIECGQASAFVRAVNMRIGPPRSIRLRHCANCPIRRLLIVHREF